MVCNGLNPSQASLRLSLWTPGMNLALLQWMHLTEPYGYAGRKEGTQLPLRLGRGWQKGWRGGVDLEGSRGIQPSPCPCPCPPPGAWGGLRGQSGRVLSLCACAAVPSIPVAGCHTTAGRGTWPHARLLHGAAVPGSRKRGAARPRRLEGWEGWGALPSLSAGPDCEQLRADKERWRWAGGRRLLPLQSKLPLPLPSVLWQRPGCLLGRESSLPQG